MVVRTFRFGFWKKYLKSSHVFHFRDNKLSIYQNKLHKLQLGKLELFGSAFSKNIQKLHMFSFSERKNYQYTRTKLRTCSCRGSISSRLLFQCIFKNYKCFPFSREKIINIFEKTLLQLQRLELFGSAFSKHIQKLHMFSFSERINYQYIRTNFRNCRYRGTNFSVLHFQLTFKNYKCLPFSREKIINIFEQRFRICSYRGSNFSLLLLQ